MIELNTELFDHAVADWAKKSHSNQDKIGMHRKLRARNWLKFRGRTNPDGMKLLHVAILGAGELCGGDTPVAHPAFFVSPLGAKLERPHGPRGQRRALLGRLRHNFKLV